MRKYQLFLLLMFSLVTAFAQERSIKKKKIPFRLVNNHILLNVSVNNSTPIVFILDSGAGTILDIDYAREHNYPLSDFRTTIGMGDKPQEVATLKNISFAINGLKFTTEKIVALALKEVSACAQDIVVDKAGNISKQSNRSKMTKEYPLIHGVLGLEFFKKFVVEIDYKKQILTVYEPANYRYKGKGKILPLETHGPHIFSNAVIKTSDSTQVTGRFMIDTGMMLAMALSPKFSSKHNLFPTPDKSVPFDLCGIGGSSAALIGSVPALIIRDIEISNPPVLFSQAKGGVYFALEFDGHIGNAILRQFKVIFDYPGARMILEK